MMEEPERDVAQLEIIRATVHQMLQQSQEGASPETLIQTLHRMKAGATTDTVEEHEPGSTSARTEEAKITLRLRKNRGAK